MIANMIKQKVIANNRLIIQIRLIGYGLLIWSSIEITKSKNKTSINLIYA